MWTEKEETLIKSVLNVDGRTNMSAIKEITPKLLDIQASSKQIYDKVRSLNRYSPAKIKRNRSRSSLRHVHILIGEFSIDQW